MLLVQQQAGLSSKSGAGGIVQKWNIRVRVRRDKGDPEVEQEVQRYIDTRLYNAPYPFSIKKIIIEFTEKLENVLYSENKSIVVC